MLQVLNCLSLADIDETMIVAVRALNAWGPPSAIAGSNPLVSVGEDYPQILDRENLIVTQALLRI